MRHENLDIFRVVLVLMVMALCAHGSDWGHYYHMHPDQMATECLHCAEGRPFHPQYFLKPPFHTYFNYFLALVPSATLSYAFDLPELTRLKLVLIWSRMITAGLMTGLVLITYAIAKRHYGLTAGRITALLLATSAGFIAFAHFLTADIPVTFWMFASFYFSANILRRVRVSDYLLAGLLCGVAMATKYNGLAIGASITTAHLMARRPETFAAAFRLLFSRNHLAAMGFIILGFLLANPYAVLDYPGFLRDFWYNYLITPVYFGETSGTSYLAFLASIPEVFGVPLTAVLLVAFVHCIRQIARDGLADHRSQLAVIAAAPLLLYFLKFGSFPRFEVRFALSALPLLLLIAARFWADLPKQVAIGLTLPLIAYGMVNSVYVGERFKQDPRMDALYDWAEANLEPGARVEYTYYSIGWQHLPERRIEPRRTPLLSGRRRMLQEVADAKGVGDLLKFYEGDDPIAFFTEEALNARRPDYFATNALYFQNFIDGPYAKHYPEIQTFFTGLLNEEYSYRLVFDRESERVPWWAYPSRIDFLENRMVVLKRVDEG